MGDPCGSCAVVHACYAVRLSDIHQVFKGVILASVIFVLIEDVILRKITRPS